MSCPLILVDGSYYCFNRYHAIKRWWSYRKTEEPQDILPSQSPVFVDKFIQTFIPSLITYRKRHSCAEARIWIAKDGAQIWRYNEAADYKAGRDKSKHPDIAFFIKLAYEELFNAPEIAHVIHHDALEADDCIALVVRRLTETKSLRSVTILTSDHDYLQLASDIIKIINMEDKDLTTSSKSTGSPDADLFNKIVCGDKSDNIQQVFPRVGPKTAMKLYADRNALCALFEKHQGSRERFEHNKKMIDFAYIPGGLCQEFYEANNALDSL